ncbi:OLC1v1020697C1 [Oldenlandia corymbosa var. corymbosa]|uniref:polynucleotide adenylyltransferase n=1 Tax=Oldenlandia corymbosa var. corymbosa TaxID=529605 RepID=A0AAV1EH72_OLDCO|nr:OLC1v1020697C1 [Oldenlandia corymbosa var. corymbosa]
MRSPAAGFAEEGQDYDTPSSSSSSSSRGSSSSSSSYTANWWWGYLFRWPEMIDLSVPARVFRWAAGIDLSYFTTGWSWPSSASTSFRWLDNLMWTLVTVLESVSIVAMICCFFLFCGCTFCDHPLRRAAVVGDKGLQNHPPSTCNSGLQLAYLDNPPFILGFCPVNPVLAGLDDVLIKMEVQRSMSLLQFMADEGLVPSPEEEIKRRNVIAKLKQIVNQWVKRVAYQCQLPKNRIRAASATILTFGSYGLGVHNAGSDIDALCVGPYFATLADDFFVVLRNMLASRPEVTEIHCIKDAKVPLMKFKFDGLAIDLPFAQLKVISVPENVDILNPFFLRNIDDTSWKSLSGVRANKSIHQLVPNIELFQSLLRCVKFWAKRRGVYGNLHGFFGGVHFAVLAAFICQRHPNASLSVLSSIFFKTFAFWPWPRPVFLHGRMIPPTIPSDSRFLMPIQLPCSPNEYCHSNITRSTFFRIRTEFLRGHTLTKDFLRPEFGWSPLFEPFPYGKKYAQFVKICLSASDQDELRGWVGWVKSRFRSLLIKLEELQGFCDPSPFEYVDVDMAAPNVVFYWGLQPSRSDIIDIDVVEEDFMKNMSNGYRVPPGRMKLSVVKASQLPKGMTAPNHGGGKGGTKAHWRVLDSSQRKTHSSPEGPQISNPNEEEEKGKRKAQKRFPSTKMSGSRAILVALSVICLVLPMLCNCDLISETCSETPNERLCVATLRKQNGSKDAKQVAELALLMVEAVQVKANETLSYIRGVQKSDLKLANTLMMCNENYNVILKVDIPKALASLKGKNKDPRFAEHGMADAGTEAQGCESSFDGVKVDGANTKSRDDLLGLNNVVFELSVVALSIIRKILHRFD